MITLFLVAGILSPGLLDFNLGLLLGLLSAGALLWQFRGRGQRPKSAEVTMPTCADERLLMQGQLGPVAPGIRPAHLAWRLAPVIDQVLERHPRLREARLAKAGILWHLHGDRDGARCYCQELLSEIEQGDPLLEQVCDLYTRTYDASSANPSPPASPSADEYHRLAKVIPLKPGRSDSIPIH